MPLWTGAVCIPRNVFDMTGGFPKGIKLGEDFILWIHIALDHKVAFLNKPLAFYNQDVNAANRGVGRLHKPEEHMLWNVGLLSDEEKSNPDYKQLIDSLRTYGLLPYYLSKEYHEAAKMELEKVDWGKQSLKIRRQYQTSLVWLRARCWFLSLASETKHGLLQVFR